MAKYGEDFYVRIGREGGKNGHTGGFADFNVGKDGLTGWERAKLAGSKGGKNSKRSRAKAKSDLHGCKIYVRHKRSKTEKILVKGA